MPSIPTKQDIKNASIMVVDDQEANIKVLEKTLKNDGYTNVTCVKDPREALQLYQAQTYDIVLLDLNMPYLSGYDVLDQLKQMTNGDIPMIIVLTAQIDRDSRLKALEKGARDFLTKPFDIVELLTRIYNMLESRLLQQQIQNQNKFLEAAVAERTRELEDTRKEIIRRLGRAAEYRDNETGFHIVRMSKIAGLMAHRMGLCEHDVTLIENASPMHDIGKIGIADNILLKPGKFTSTEWEQMKTHTTIGAEMLSGHDSDLLNAARIIALTHHEKWDGSGYPNALKAQDIPLYGRIVAVADVFDALTSVRPYKHAWNFEDAVNYIKDQAGSHFDPNCAEIFLSSLEDVLAIKQAYPEPDNKNITHLKQANND